jgi:hypothetical protein
LYVVCASVFGAVLLGLAGPGSAATISSPTVQAGEISFECDSGSNQLMTLQASDSLSGLWSDLRYHFGDGNPASFSTPVNAQQRFFRVRTTPFQTFDLTPSTPTLAAGSVSLPDAVVGTLYSERVSAALTGLPPYTIQVDGTPPDGVMLVVLSNGTANATVRVSANGVGLAAGQRRQFTVSAIDSSGTTLSRTYDLRVIAPAPEILTTSVVLKAGEAFNTTLRATNGSGPLVWSFVAGPSVSGISLSSIGELAGTPSTEDAEFQEIGRFTNLVQVSDSFTDRVTGVATPRSATNMLVQLVRLSYHGNIWAQRPNGPSLGGICFFCHGPGFTPDVSDIATTIIGAPSQESVSCPGRVYIVPGNPEASLIYQKLRGPDCGDRMPQGGPYFDDVSLGRVARWFRELTLQDTD